MVPEDDRPEAASYPGARQTGKTTAVRLFAEQNGLDLIELNMEKTWFFSAAAASNDPRALVTAIEFELNRAIDPEHSLLFFDEIQAEPRIIGILRYFYEEIPELPVIATGSLLEFALAEPVFSLPVGRVELYHMGPFSFEEFLSALNQDRVLGFLGSFEIKDTVPEALHRQISTLMRHFVFVGGMPEAIAVYKETESLKEVEKIKAGIIQTFILDFAKYRHNADVGLLRTVFESLPGLIGRKLIYARIADGIRSDRLSEAVNQLRMAKLVEKVFHSSANGIPLAAEKNERLFKTLHLDIGLLVSQTGLNPVHIQHEADLNLVNNGVLAEQLVGQELLQICPRYREPELFYWVREQKTSSAEVDYVIADDSGHIVPVEVKSGKTGSLRSLQVFADEKRTATAVRFNSEPPSVFQEERRTPNGKPVKFRLISLPHYLAGQVGRLLGQRD